MAAPTSSKTKGIHGFLVDCLKAKLLELYIALTSGPGVLRKMRLPSTLRPLLVKFCNGHIAKVIGYSRYNIGVFLFRNTPPGD